LPTGLFQPVPNFDFFVMMWEVQGPSLFGGGTGGKIASGAISAAVSIGSQFLFGSFAEVQGLEAQVEVEDYRQGGENAAPRRLIKAGTYPDLVFRRGVGFDTSLADWYYQVKAGASTRIRKDGFVLALDRGGLAAGKVSIGLPLVDRVPVAGWFFRRAFPKAVDGPQLQAKGNEIAMERLVLGHEGLDRISPALIEGAADAFGALGGLAPLLTSAGLGAVLAGSQLATPGRD
jgi:phage tail-like protein